MVKKTDLKKYVEKRNFTKTPEPAADEAVPSGKENTLHFVVHKHAASRLHFDLRLEIDGLLRSWAIPKGPSFDPLESRLAVKVEDHPLRYRDFEQVIPPGNYGAGTMMIWDEGTYGLFEALPGESHSETFARQLRKGSLKLSFHGQKMRGEFTLVKIKKSEGKDWLLIKKRDAFASTSFLISENDRSVRSGRTMQEIADGEKPQKLKLAKKERPSLRKRGDFPGDLAEVSVDRNWKKEPGKILALAMISSEKLQVKSTKGLDLTSRCGEILADLQRSFADETILVGHIEWASLATKMKKSRFHVLDILWIKGRPSSLSIEEKSKLIAKSATEPARDFDPKKATAVPKSFVLTNPQKIFFPDLELTKKDVFEYYKEISPILLRYLRDRPQSLNRHPNGINGKSFYQKEVAGSVPGWVKTVNIAAYGGTKTVTQLVCQDFETLATIVNMGCIELNVWLSRIPDIFKPDFAVIDIDPGTLAWEEVVASAEYVRKILEKIEAHSFCKTSGGRGLHIYIPTDGKATFAETQEFAELIGELLERKFPSKTSTNRNPMLRRQKIYIDSLQNRKGQTMACVYSLRPREGAPVSTPIAWKELSVKNSPLAYNLRTVLKRVNKVGDLWETMQQHEHSISQLNKKLSQML